MGLPPINSRVRVDHHAWVVTYQAPSENADGELTSAGEVRRPRDLVDADGKPWFGPNSRFPHLEVTVYGYHENPETHEVIAVLWRSGGYVYGTHPDNLTPLKSDRISV